MLNGALLDRTREIGAYGLSREIGAFGLLSSFQLCGCGAAVRGAAGADRVAGKTGVTVHGGVETSFWFRPGCSKFLIHFVTAIAIPGSRF